MIIGSHTISHPCLSKLDKKEQEKEIIESFDYLSRIIDHKINTFCIPYGGIHTFNNHTINILKNSDYSFAFNVESKNITNYDLNHSIYALPRYDCNEFMYGECN